MKWDGLLKIPRDDETGGVNEDSSLVLIDVGRKLKLQCE